MEERAYDVVVFGASGFTGRLAAEHMAARHGEDASVRWAIAGRSRAKLEAVRKEIGASQSVALVFADASDPASLLAMAQKARAVITTVGPYQRCGEGMVAACAEAGADYVDLCGEPAWMAQMIEKYDAAAKASGARIVFSCGFDSIPFDLGVSFLQTQAQARFGAAANRVRARVRKMKGGVSGGTVASLMATLEAARRNPSIRKTLEDPFALTPGFRGPFQPAGDRAVYDEKAGAWAAPFIMASINTKTVHRTNFLRGHPFGRDFVYDEMLLTGDGAKGKKRARRAETMGKLQDVLLGIAPARALIRSFALPKPGEGPSMEQRQAGCYDVLFIGEVKDGRELRASVKGEEDPGYASTSRMIVESAMCLVREVAREETPGGVWTPGAAMGAKLTERLETHAGLRFAVEA